MTEVAEATAFGFMAWDFGTGDKVFGRDAGEETLGGTDLPAGFAEAFNLADGGGLDLPPGLPSDLGTAGEAFLPALNIVSMLDCERNRTENLGSLIIDL